MNPPGCRRPGPPRRTPPLLAIDQEVRWCQARAGMNNSQWLMHIFKSYSQCSVFNTLSMTSI